MGEWVAREGGHLDGCFYDSIASLYDLHTMEVNIWRILLSLKKRYQIITIGAAGKSILKILTILLLLLLTMLA